MTSLSMSSPAIGGQDALSMDQQRTQELKQGMVNLNHISPQVDGRISNQLNSFNPEEQEILKKEICDEVFKAGGECAKVDIILFNAEDNKIYVQVDDFKDITVNPETVLAQSKLEPSLSSIISETEIYSINMGSWSKINNAISEPIKGCFPYTAPELVNKFQGALTSEISKTIQDDSINVSRLTMKEGGGLEAIVNGTSVTLEAAKMKTITSEFLNEGKESSKLDIPTAKIQTLKEISPKLDAGIDAALKEVLPHDYESRDRAEIKAELSKIVSDLKNSRGQDPIEITENISIIDGKIIIDVNDNIKVSADLNMLKADYTTEQLKAAFSIVREGENFAAQADGAYKPNENLTIEGVGKVTQSDTGYTPTGSVIATYKDEVSEKNAEGNTIKLTETYQGRVDLGNNNKTDQTTVSGSASVTISQQTTDTDRKALNAFSHEVDLDINHSFEKDKYSAATTISLNYVFQQQIGNDSWGGGTGLTYETENDLWGLSGRGSFEVNRDPVTLKGSAKGQWNSDSSNMITAELKFAHNSVLPGLFPQDTKGYARVYGERNDGFRNGILNGTSSGIGAGLESENDHVRFFLEVGVENKANFSSSYKAKFSLGVNIPLSGQRYK